MTSTWQSDQVNDLITSLGMRGYNHTATRVTEHSSTLIDVIFSDIPTVCEGGVYTTDVSDHFSLLTLYFLS